MKWGALLVVFLFFQSLHSISNEFRLPSLERNNSGGQMEFVYIPGNTFRMGCSAGDEGCYDDEKPPHEVRVSGFYLGRYEVTQGQWVAIMGKNPSYFQDCGLNCPVESVSWNAVQEFIQKLNERSGGKVRYRLPTEAEWEYAARAGTTEKYHWGKEIQGDYLWYRENSEGKTHPVGEKLPNPWGLYDMQGNVWEWCEDWYSDSYYSDSPSENPKGPREGTGRKVLRGGSWDHFTGYVRSSVRGGYYPASVSTLVGFRLVAEY